MTADEDPGSSGPSRPATAGRGAVLALAGIVLAAIGCGQREARDPGWETLEPGLAVGRFHLCDEPPDAPPSLVVLRADPDRFTFRVLAASSTAERVPRTAREWAKLHDLAVATNAGMFHPDYLRHVGLMIAGDHVNNGVAVRSYRSVLAFRPRDAADPPFVLADLDETPLEELRDRYEVLVQNLRMIDASGANVWEPSDRSWSAAALGIDGRGRILMLFNRDRRSIHDLIDCLLQLPIDVRRAQYLEGGPEAVLYVAAGDRTLEFVGSGSPTADEAAGLGFSFPIPNVIGLERRDPGQETR